MPKLPIISGKNLIKVLKKNGFIVLRKKGSHVFVESENRVLNTVVPVHGNEDLGKGLLKSNETEKDRLCTFLILSITHYKTFFRAILLGLSDGPTYIGQPPPLLLPPPSLQTQPTEKDQSQQQEPKATSKQQDNPTAPSSTPATQHRGVSDISMLYRVSQKMFLCPIKIFLKCVMV